MTAPVPAPVSVYPGDSPLILSAPHAGVDIPDDIKEHLNDRGLMIADTDWRIDQLYDGLAPAATFIKATFHRYVIDANRASDDETLYPGQNTTGLCPITDFDGNPIWRQGGEPSPDDIEKRREAFHAPYHRAIEQAIATSLERHGVAVLYDCHSIRSHIPYLFTGQLPVLNIGTNSGQSCSTVLEKIMTTACKNSNFSTVLNGRFKGGWTTRHYGVPANHVHAIQMEIAQRAYMTEAPPWRYDPEKAKPLRAMLARILGQIERAALKGALSDD